MAATAPSGLRLRPPLPAPLTSLIGREQDVLTGSALLEQPATRLVTLYGPPGVGKTRLALRIAEEIHDYFADGVCFVALAEVTAPEQVLPAIAEALGIPRLATEPVLDQVTYYLRSENLLLLLDNMEQVAGAATELAMLLGRCPFVKLLVTSRTLLQVTGERPYAVQPLTVPPLDPPPSAETLARYSAVELFVERARTVLHSFRVTPANAGTVAQLCARLDGLPLAIELAALRVQLLSPAALLSQLSHRFEVLSRRAREVNTRHRTLFDAIGWSYDLLEPSEQRLFRQLAVFVGSWTVQAAEAVCTVDDGLSVIDGLSALLDKSLLLRVEDPEGGEPRLQMLLAVREYALVQVRARDELAAAELAHARYMLAFALEAERGLMGGEQLAWLARLDRELDNLRAALQRSIERGEAPVALGLCAALGHYWFLRGHWEEGRRWVGAALALGGPVEALGATHAKVLYVAGELAWYQYEYEEAQRCLSESAARYRALGDERGLILPLGTLGALLQEHGELAVGAPLVAECEALCHRFGCRWERALILQRVCYALWKGGQREQALAAAQESLLLATEFQDHAIIAAALGNLGYDAWQHGDLPRAAVWMREAVALARALRNTYYLVSALDTLGTISVQHGDLAAANDAMREALALSRALGGKAYAGYPLVGLARIAAARGEWWRAASLLGAADREYSADRYMNPTELAAFQADLARIRDQLGRQRFDAAWTEGHLLDAERILNRPEPAPDAAAHEGAAVRGLGSLAANAALGPNALTPREQDVLRLLAEGLTDAQIAQRLVISPRTVNRHTTTIYSKLHVSSRSAATRYAIEHHLC